MVRINTPQTPWSPRKITAGGWAFIVVVVFILIAAAVGNSGSSGSSSGGSAASQWCSANTAAVAQLQATEPGVSFNDACIVLYRELGEP